MTFVGQSNERKLKQAPRLNSSTPQNFVVTCVLQKGSLQMLSDSRHIRGGVQQQIVMWPKNPHDPFSCFFFHRQDLVHDTWDLRIRDRT